MWSHSSHESLLPDPQNWSKVLNAYVCVDPLKPQVANHTTCPRTPSIHRHLEVHSTDANKCSERIRVHDAKISPCLGADTWAWASPSSCAHIVMKVATPDVANNTLFLARLTPTTSMSLSLRGHTFAALNGGLASICPSLEVAKVLCTRRLLPTALVPPE